MFEHDYKREAIAWSINVENLQAQYNNAIIQQCICNSHIRRFEEE